MLKLGLRRLIRRAINRFNPKNNHIKLGIRVSNEWYGNQYGGFYINPDLLKPDSVVYSFGIGEDISFDMEIIERHGCKIYGFDPTPRSIAWIKSQELPNNFSFYSYGISNESGLQYFHLPKNKSHVSGSLVEHGNVSIVDQVSVEMKSFKDIITQLGHCHIDVIKMDIEGSEYDIMDGILSSGVLIDQFLIEFHERFFDDGKSKTIEIINNMNDKGYEIFAISDSFQEISFIRSQR